MASGVSDSWSPSFTPLTPITNTCQQSPVSLNRVEDFRLTNAVRKTVDRRFFGRGKIPTYCGRSGVSTQIPSAAGTRSGRCSLPFGAFESRYAPRLATSAAGQPHCGPLQSRASSRLARITEDTAFRWGNRQRNDRNDVCRWKGSDRVAKYLEE